MRENASARHRVLRTIAYADAAGMPLTVFSCWRFSIVEGKGCEQEERGITSPLVDVLRVLDALVREGIVIERYGYYAFPDRTKLIEDWLARTAFLELKLSRARQWARRIVRLPYVRGVFAYGSLATGNMKEDSDLDIFVVTAPGRIFLARFFVSWFTELFGVRRTATRIRNRVCLNHYATESALACPEPYRNLPTAWLWAQMFPLALRSPALSGAFLRANHWATDFFPHEKEMDRNSSELAETRSDELRKRSGKISANFYGFPMDFFERLSRFFQIRKIHRNPLTYRKGGRVVANDDMLIFHPELPEERKMRAYRDRLSVLGVHEENVG